jgi:hypothetical protein
MDSVVRPSQCPKNPDDIAEALALGRLLEEHASVFREHVLTCSRCRETLQTTEEYVRAMKAAAQRLEDSVSS